MIAIVESGTTKTNWLFVDKNNNSFEYKTIGMNPYYQTSDDIQTNLEDSLVPNLTFGTAVDAIYFYGAGCELQAQREVVANGIKRVFKETQININHDLLAAARALFADEAGIACIAGTGSNSCLYSGKDVIWNIHSLGLFMGDEGSGGYKGKLLVSDYIRKAMPEHIREKFEAKYTDRTKEILDAVYLKPFPSRYLASFMPFIVENMKDEYIYKLVYRSFENQFDNTICRYSDYQKYDIGFVGSVAHYCKDIMLEVAKKKNARVTKIVQNPLGDLVNYHKNNGLVK
jgi:N-acetylglucosamine kinase-like BadF-type ATPase